MLFGGGETPGTSSPCPSEPYRSKILGAMGNLKNFKLFKIVLKREMGGRNEAKGIKLRVRRAHMENNRIQLCLRPPHAYPMGVKYMTGWFSTSGAVGSNLKSETQTGAKILRV
ncbi:hypothetical protein TNCV_1768591 [Trichonephila clavipes]|nr:hypothetical protein TNCV_1768591 [Trichonephila clavipes]